MIGILAYGSLIVRPGEELKAATEQIIDDTRTPFEVEYARRSSSRAGAPTLVIVPDGFGSPVQARILYIKRDIKLDEAKNVLYRREINKIGDLSIKYTEPEGNHFSENRVVIDGLHQYAGLDVVLFTRISSNLPNILNQDLTSEQKAIYLAELAIESLTEETYLDCRDGIQYLFDNLASGIMTPLTEIYCKQILNKAISAKNLIEARDHFARQRGLINKDAN